MKTIRKNTAVFLILFAFMAGMVPALYAEMIQGEITEVDPGGTYLRIARNDPENNAAEPESIKVSVSQATVYEEAGGLEELRSGDEVWADISFDEKTKVWSAAKIRLDKVDIKAPGDAEAARAASEADGVQ